MLDIITRSIVSTVIPAVAVANSGIKLARLIVEDGEVQRHRAVGSVNVVEILRVITRAIVGGVVPLVGDASRVSKLAEG